MTTPPTSQAHLDERRSARLLFAPELGAGRIGESALALPEVAEAVAARPVPSTAARFRERVQMKRGRLDWQRHSLEPMLAARRAVLGDAAAGHPRLLIRVDEFPHYKTVDEPARFGLEAFRVFRSIMAGANVPYLLALVPRPPRKPLASGAEGGRVMTLAERDELRALRGERVTFALHGLDHRTRDPRPRHHSEFLGLSAAQVTARLDTAEKLLADFADVRPRVFVPPYNRFEAEHYDLLASRYDIVCGGPESVVRMGFHPTPQFRGDAVWLPSYPPLYGRAADLIEPVRELVEQRAAVWAPIVLHWGWEAEQGWEGLRALVELIAPHARPWEYFLAAIEASRNAAQVSAG